MAGLPGGNWQIVREDTSISFGDLFAEFDGDGQKALAAIVANRVCLPPTMALAYYGDPTALCP
jgi:hypothetical protein